MTGCSTDDAIACASTSVPASVWLIPRQMIRYGSKAGMKLWLRSSETCAVASKAMERTSSRDTSLLCSRDAVLCGDICRIRSAYALPEVARAGTVEERRP